MEDNRMGPWAVSRFLSCGEDCWPPHEINLEIVEGCALRCEWCGVRGIREDGDGTLRLASPSLWQQMARELAEMQWLSRVVISGRGEPLLHPRFDQCLDAFRRTSPRTVVWVETSGYRLVNPNLRQEDPIFFAAANRLASMVEAGMSAVLVRRRRGSERVWDVLSRRRDDLEQFVGVRVLHGLLESPRHLRRENHIWLAPDNVRGHMSHSPADNHAGAGAEMGPWPTKGRRRTRACLRPIEEMAVRWDGRVAMCQDDYRGEVCLGDITRSGLWSVYYGDVARAARARLGGGLRDLRPCASCDHISDWSGWNKESDQRTAPTSGHAVVMRAALARGSMTSPVLRRWEG